MWSGTSPKVRCALVAKINKGMEFPVSINSIWAHCLNLNKADLATPIVRYFVLIDIKSI